LPWKMGNHRGRNPNLQTPSSDGRIPEGPVAGKKQVWGERAVFRKGWERKKGPDTPRSSKCRCRRKGGKESHGGAIGRLVGIRESKTTGEEKEGRDQK